MKKRIPAWFWQWAQWYLGRDRFKGHARNPRLRPKSAPRKIPAWAWSKLALMLGKKPAPKPVPQPFSMFDSIDLSQIPGDAVAVAGYVNGHWPTYTQLAQRFPKAMRLSIAVTSAVDADCLDVERGDAEPWEAPIWVKRQLARGVKRPVIYTSVSQAPAVLAELKRKGIDRKQIRLWTAHYTFEPHRCSASCGFGFSGVADATQYTDSALGRNLDESFCAPDFLSDSL